MAIMSGRTAYDVVTRASIEPIYIVFHLSLLTTHLPRCVTSVAIKSLLHVVSMIQETLTAEIALSISLETESFPDCKT